VSDVLHVRRDGPFAHVTLARPGVRNAFNAEMIAELRAAFEALALEPSSQLRGVVLAGEGSVFCAGADVEWMRSAIGLSADDNERDAAAMQAMLTAIDECPAPVIARVQGAALGGGMGLCAASDVVVAAADATFGFTEAKLGIVPAVISTFVLPRIGPSHARALFTTGQRFDARRALGIGLVHEVVADEAGLDARVAELLGELDSAGPDAARAAKSLVRDVAGLPAAEARDEVVRRIARLRTSSEGQEGLAAFVEKRSPSWRGRA
jgi:methylglutaconyl-CoA hydratase